MPRRPWAHRGPSQRLASLPMHGVEAAVRAELLQLHPVRVVAPVLLGDVVPVLALVAGQRDLRADVGGCHGAAFLTAVLELAPAPAGRRCGRTSVAEAGLEPATQRL